MRQLQYGTTVETSFILMTSEIHLKTHENMQKTVGVYDYVK